MKRAAVGDTDTEVDSTINIKISDVNGESNWTTYPNPIILIHLEFIRNSFQMTIFNLNSNDLKT